MRKFDYKVALISSVLAFSGIGILVQCAPKKSEAPSAGKQEKVQNISNLVEGIDFAKLESSTDVAAKQVYKTLKEKSMPDSHVIAMAIAEQHLKAAGKQSDNQSGMALLGEITTAAQKSKITKMEDLRNIYDTIDTAKNTKFKTGNREHNLVGVMEKAEVSAYSAPILIALTWIKSSVATAKAVVVISPGTIELGEIRADTKIVSFDSGEKGNATKELGKQEEVIKKARLIPLNLFLIHEILKSYAANPHEWANRVLQTSATELMYKVAADLVISTTIQADATKIEESVLLFGKTTELKDSEMTAKPAAGTPAAGTPAAGTPAAGTPAAGTPAVGTPAVGTPAVGTPAAGIAYEFKVNGAAKSYSEFKKLLISAQKKQLLGFIKRHYSIEDDKKEITVKDLKINSGAMVVARVEKLDESQIKSIEVLGQEVAKQIRSALELKKQNKVESVLLVQVKKKEGIQVNLVTEEEQGQETKLVPGNTLTIKPELADFILKIAENSKIDLDNVISIEIVKKN